MNIDNEAKWNPETQTGSYAHPIRLDVKTPKKQPTMKVFKIETSDNPYEPQKLTPSAKGLQPLIDPFDLSKGRKSENVKR